MSPSPRLTVARPCSPSPVLSHQYHTARALRGDSQTDGPASIAAEKSQEQPKATPAAESESSPPATVPAAGRARIRRSTRGRGRQRHILRHHLSHRRDRATKAGSSHLIWTCPHHRTSRWSLTRAVLPFLQPEPDDGTDLASSYYLFYTFFGSDVMSPQFAELTDPLPLSERYASSRSRKPGCPKAGLCRMPPSA